MPDEALTIPALDRAFEHGLGLFETLRTWEGRAPLLGRHLRRMTDSARALGLHLNPARLPTPEAVSALLQAENFRGDALLRITMTGGTDEPGSAVVWMRARTLPPPGRAGGAIVETTWEVSRDDSLARHKSLNYWGRRRAHERAIAAGTDELLSRSADGRYWEGSRTSLFLVAEQALLTPPASGPIVPGVMRGLVVDQGAIETEVDFALLDRASEAFLTNSVRGIIPIGRLFGRDLPAPGPIAGSLASDLDVWCRELARSGRNG